MAKEIDLKKFICSILKCCESEDVYLSYVYKALKDQGLEWNGKEIVSIEQESAESTDLRTWKYIVDAVLTERNGIGQYLDSPWTEYMAKKLQERFGSIEQEPARVPKFKVGDKVHLINGTSPNYEDDCITIGEISKSTYYGDAKGGWFLIKDQDKFELVEQKPVEIDDAWIDDYWKHHKVNNPDSYNKGDEIQFDYDGFKRFCSQFKQKPVEWSEEDSKMLDFAIRAVGLCRQYAINNQVNGHSNLPDAPQKYTELQNWLKSLRPQPKQGLSEDEEGIIATALSNTYSDDIATKLLNRIKSIRPQKQEWSKEDERMIKIVKEMAYTIAQTSDKQFLERHGTNEQELKNWSLSCSPQKQWRPSEGHLKGLRRGIINTEEGSDAWYDLKDLYEQLKNL